MKRLFYNWLIVLLLLPALGLFAACGGDDDDDNDDNDDGDDDDNGDDDDDEQPACVDEDGDGFGENCDAGPDCNDVDPGAWQVLTGYTDADGDGYPGTAVDVCSGELLPPDYFAGSEDCDDGDAMVNPDAVELPDDGIDQDCDGGDLTASDTNGVFVDEAADPGGDGSMANPFQTVADGITEAESKADGLNVYIAEGTYTEQVVTSSSLFGGYDGSDWSRDIVANVTEIVADGTDDTVVEVGPMASVVLDGLTLSTPDALAAPIGVASGGAHWIQVSRVGMSLGTSTNDSNGVYTTGTYVDVFDVQILLGAAVDEAIALVVQSGSLRAYDTEVDVAGSPGSTQVCFYAGAGGMVLRDSTCTTGEAGEGYGIYSTSGAVDAERVDATIGDATGNAIGANLSNGVGSIRNSVFNVGESGATAVGIYSPGSSLDLFNNTIAVGDSTGSDSYGVYAQTIAPFQTLVAANNLVRAGDANSLSIGIRAEGMPPVLIGNSFAAGEGNASLGAYVNSATPFFSPFVIANNVFVTNTAVADEWPVYLVTPPGTAVADFFHNDLWGASPDCLLYDGVDCLTTVADVNDCAEWNGCGDTGGNLNTNPMFVSATDLHLEEGSDLVDAGINPVPLDGAIGDYLWMDVDLDQRPLNGGWDIGGDEFVVP